MLFNNRRQVIRFCLMGSVFSAAGLLICFYSQKLVSHELVRAAVLFVFCSLFISYNVAKCQPKDLIRFDFAAFAVSMTVSMLMLLSIALRFLLTDGNIGRTSIFSVITDHFGYFILLLTGLFLFFYLLLFAVRSYFLAPRTLRPVNFKARFLFFAAGYAFIFAVLYSRTFPYVSSPDTLNQWQQIHGELSYNRIHTIGHTILLRLLLGIHDDYTTVIIFQLICLSAVYALFSEYFAKKGLHPLLILFVFSAAAVVSYLVTKAYYAPWKDTPAALCAAVVLYIILGYLDRGGMNSRTAAVLGFSLAGCFIFRLNGIIVLAVCGAYFAFTFLRRRNFRQLAAMIMAIIASISAVELYAERKLKPIEMENGFSVQVFVSGIAAMVKSDVLSREELEEVDGLLSLEWMRENYEHPAEKRDLIWQHDDSPEIAADPDLAIFNNSFVLAAGKNKKDIVQLYLKLLPRHFAVCLKDALGSIFMMWRTDSFFLCSYAFQVLLTVFMAIKTKLGIKDSLIFLPTLCNTFSIMISTITNETRYLLPTFMLMPVFFLYIIWKRSQGSSAASASPIIVK